MNEHTTEQAVRQEAIRRRLLGESREQICRDLERSTSWFDKWWRAYRDDPQIDFTDRSRAPHTSPQATPPSVIRAIVSTRKILEMGKTPETRYGFIGAGSIQTQLERLGLKSVPSEPTIQRILAAAGLTHPLGAGHDTAYYPWPIAWAVNAIHATDIITRHLRGGEEIENFHTIDLFSHAVQMTRQLNKTSATAREHLQKTWVKLGLPHLQQFDNDDVFRGGHTHPRVIGQVVRLCLFCGIEPFFTPIYEAKRNHQIETFHGLWVLGFWSRHKFANRNDVDQEIPLFEHWYHRVYQPPELDGYTPAQMRRGVPIQRLTPDLQRLIPPDQLPITAGRIHIMRKVDSTGQISFLNERWLVGSRWVGEYVRATINTAQQRVTFWHQAEAQADWHWIKTRQFRLQESVHDLLPAFHRKCTRCRDGWPD